MEILEFVEFMGSISEPPMFHYSIVVYSEDNQTFTARTSARLSRRNDVDLSELEDIAHIPKHAFQPTFSETFTQAAPTDHTFIKCPSLSSYYHLAKSPNDSIAKDLLQEVKVCELLRLHPHPNIAVYTGCAVEEGRISGLCFNRYKESLQQRLNPGHLGKHAFAESSQHLNHEWRSRIVDGINDALCHLHAMGLVHNDLSPANIMLDVNDIPKLIDFGSARPIDHSLEHVGRTPEWYNENVNTAQTRNDLDALAEIDAWMGDRTSGLVLD